MSEEFVNCSTHGRQAVTFVCQHILESLRDAVPRGFKFTRDEDGNYNSLCSACSAVNDEEWERIGGEVIRILCFGCFQRAAEINGVVVAKGSA